MERRARYEWELPQARFLGWLSEDRLAAAYTQCDFVLFETFGLVILEAMAAGLCVVVANAGRQLGYVVDEVNGVVCELDVGRVEERIGCIFADRVKLEEIGERARRFAQSATWEKTFEFVLENLTRLASIQERQ